MTSSALRTFDARHAEHGSSHDSVPAPVSLALEQQWRSELHYSAYLVSNIAKSEIGGRISGSRECELECANALYRIGQVPSILLRTTSRRAVNPPESLGWAGMERRRRERCLESDATPPAVDGDRGRSEEPPQLAT